MSDLSTNVIAANALRLDAVLAGLGGGLSMGELDLVIGNPPWGAQMGRADYQHACALAGVSAAEQWDSWEVFLLLGLKALKPGGRLAFVLPDSLTYPKKARVREVLVRDTRILRLHVLGPDWFGPRVSCPRWSWRLRSEHRGCWTTTRRCC